MYGYIYITINKINGKIYIGQKKSSKYVDSYYGSGRILLKAIDKYGKENFVNHMIDCANTQEELDEKEKCYISFFKNKYKDKCYNIAEGASGGNVFRYANKEEKEAFKLKMTKINRERCKSKEFKDKISQKTSLRYNDVKIREEHSKRLKEVWSDKYLREKHSKLLKEYYKDNKRDCSFNNQKCVFQLNSKTIIFESIKELRNYLKRKYNYNPDRRTFNKIMNSGKPYEPYHKHNEKLLKLKGMIIYKYKEGVETKCDECNTVE